MAYLTREKITTLLNAQFSDIRKNIKSGAISTEDAKTLIMSEDDICDSKRIEPDSSNYHFARAMQHQFINFELSAL